MRQHQVKTYNQNFYLLNQLTKQVLLIRILFINLLLYLLLYLLNLSLLVLMLSMTLSSVACCQYGDDKSGITRSFEKHY